VLSKTKQREQRAKEKKRNKASTAMYRLRSQQATTKKGEQKQNVAKLKHFEDRTTSLKSKTIPRSSTHKVINIS